VSLVLLPLTVLGFQIYRNLAANEQQRVVVQEVVPLAEERLRMTLTEAALDEEVNWQVAAVEVDKLGVSNDVVLAATGLDLEATVARAATRTDGILPERYRSEVDTLRSSEDDPVTLNQSYHDLIDYFDAEGQELSNRLEALSVGLDGGSDLLQAVKITEFASDAEIAIGGAWENWNGFRVEPDPKRAARTLEQLITRRSEYARAQSSIEAGLQMSPLAPRHQAVRDDPSVQKFWRLIEAEIEKSVIEGVAVPSGDAVSASIQDPGVLPELAPALIESRQLWQDFAMEAGDELIATAEQLEASANEEIALDRTLLIGIGSITLLLTLLGAGLISRSIRQLAASADSLQLGSDSIPAASGPKEVYLAGSAMSEASANLDLLRRQADALADGTLDHPDLQQVAPGKIGASLKGAVDRLSSSIHDRELLKAAAAWEANHDGLTGLPNRSAALTFLSSLLGPTGRSGVTVMFVDLDGFKTVNDGHGHNIGDDLLKELAERLQSQCRPEDKCCRIGGDEFVMILGSITDDDEVHAIAQSIRDAMAMPYTLPNGVPISVSASIGVATSRPKATVSSLLREADLGAYAAKRAGRDQFVICTEELVAEADRTRELTTDILVAADQDQFRMEYQPILDANGQVVSAEALIRWDHPTLGLVMPDEFIGKAERSEVITTVDRWVVREVARQMKLWDDHHPALSHIRVAANISSRHLNVPSFLSDILDPLMAYEIDPRRLTIEVTETSLLENLELAGAQLRQLREKGIRVAIDDFGTGYSAITHLRYLPIDIIKIDRSFVSGMADPHGQEEALVRLCIATGQMLGATIVAEGVETALQARMLKEMGADHFQGWLYSRSIAPESFPDFVKNWQAPIDGMQSTASHVQSEVSPRKIG